MDEQLTSAPNPPFRVYPTPPSNRFSYGNASTMTTPAVAPAPPTSEGTYARQDALKLKAPEIVLVVGCGGVGSWLSLFLALAGVKQLWLWDNDTVSDHNLNRLPVTKDALGKLKSEAMLELIQTYRPDCEVYAMGMFSKDQADIINADLRVPSVWVVATTDTWASRKMCHEWAAENGYSYLEAAAEGEIGSITGEPAGWATEDETKPGYASVPVWVGPCAFAASLACSHILHNTRLGSESIRIGWTDKGIVYYNSAKDHPEPVAAPMSQHKSPREYCVPYIEYGPAGTPSATYYSTVGCNCVFCNDVRNGVDVNARDRAGAYRI